MKKIFSIAILLLFASCSKPHYGCTKKEVRQSVKHFKKSVNWCNAEAMRQSLIYYPFKESDSSWSEYKKGVDTFWRMSEPIIYDCDEFIRQRDSLAKLGVKTQKKASVKCPDCPYTIDEINHYKQTIKEDGRVVGLLQNDIGILNKRLLQAIEDKISAEKGKAKSDGKLLVFYWALGIVAGMLAIRFAVKNFKPKIPFFGVFILLFFQSCVTIYVTEKPIVSKKPTHKYCSYGTQVLSIGGLTDEQYFESYPHNCKLDTPYRNQQEPLTFPVWRTNEPIRQDDGSFTPACKNR